LGTPILLSYYPKARDAFWNSLGNSGARVYFAGHDHLYDRAHIADGTGHNIYQVIVGSGGAPMTKWKGPEYFEGPKVVGDYHGQKRYGYVLVTVTGLHIKVEWRAMGHDHNLITWGTLDTFEYTIN